MATQPIIKRHLEIMPRRMRRMIEAEVDRGKTDVIHWFMWNVKKEQPEIIHPERLHDLAADLFGYKKGCHMVGEELGEDFGDADRVKLLVQAILHYMVLNRKIILSRKHFYWRDYNYKEKRRVRSVKQQRLEWEEKRAMAEITPEQQDEIENEDDNGGGDVLQLKSLEQLKATETPMKPIVATVKKDSDSR